MSSKLIAEIDAPDLPKRHTKLWVIGAMAFVLLFGLVFRRALGPSVRVATVARTSFDERLVATGRVEPDARAELGVLIAGIAREVPHREGDHVKAGTLLLRLSDAQLNAQLEDARALEAEGRARLFQLSRVSARVADASLRRAEVELKNAELELARSRQLAAAGSIATQKVDEAQRSVETARTARDAAEAQALGTGRNGADLMVARAALARASAQVALAEARLLDARIIAPVDGVVAERDVDVGDVVQPGKVLFELISDATPQIVLFVDERNLSALRLGQSAKVSADAFASESVKAHVSFISPRVDAERGTVEVRLKLDENPAYLRTDMTVSVDIALGKQDGALAVPADAVRDGASDHPSVLVVDGERKVVSRRVKLGLRSDALVEILSGLEQGETVITQTGLSLIDGQKVRPKAAP